MRITIRTRILLLFTGIVFTQALILGAFFLSQHSKFLSNQVDNQLKTITESLSSEIINYLNNTIHNLQPTTQRVTRIPLDPHRQHSFSNTTKISTAPHTTPASNKLSDHIDHKTLQDILNKTICPADQRIIILDDQGTVLAQKLQNGLRHQSFPANRNWNKEVIIDGTHFITASSSLYYNDHKIIIVGMMDKQKAQAPSLKTFRFLIFLVLLLFLFSLLIGWTTRQHIITPLQRLARSSGKLLQGKEIDISHQGDAELQDLAKTLNAMNKELRESNMTLEQEVTLRHREEKKAIQARIDAEKASQLKSIFLANMSHEIRTPLNAMLGLLNMLDKGPLNKEQKKLLAMASISGQRLQALVNSVLDLSQIESGKFQLHHSVFTLSSLITEVIELMQIHANEKNLVLKANQDADIPDILQGDSGRIRQILVNLLNNSIKYTDHGEIHLTVQLESISNDKELVLLFCIKDSGREIPAEIQESIFNPFNQGKIDTDKVTEGIGLGLAISDEFVHYMQGKIWLEKSDENGSMFCFTIRCEKGEKPIPAHREEQENPRNKLAGIKILLADDEYINQRIVSAYLEELGATVGICDNGAELLKQMDEETPDIILMDIRMPILDGIETTKLIREKEASTDLDRIPIIALTAQATTDFEAKCKEAGMDDYITKPIPFDNLTRIIGELYEKEVTQQSASVN